MPDVLDQSEINALLEANPDLLKDIRAKLAESWGTNINQRQTIGNNSKGVQLAGSNNTVNN